MCFLECGCGSCSLQSALRFSERLENYNTACLRFNLSFDCVFFLGLRGKHFLKLHWSWNLTFDSGLVCHYCLRYVTQMTVGLLAVNWKCAHIPVKSPWVFFIHCLWSSSSICMTSSQQQAVSLPYNFRREENISTSLYNFTETSWRNYTWCCIFPSYRHVAVTFCCRHRSADEPGCPLLRCVIPFWWLQQPGQASSHPVHCETWAEHWLWWRLH